ncbi:hypothetical protein EI42_05924 [Thermosporothrix hazakensis]|uniref:Uncharacterized protein n=1 Tax=Thermosporothrix hazakensis TaxID=644383 RepID=A0A326TVA8_THEHA|nr:hypothetical protein [Thermosporothrix hazakensis]PZW20551.1 hypothetical protein EI42_05924 [Thermosporothrix hazakensis]GCE51477.1 hypothetical protein KTH_63460 [Thermosporothrix hazakensis]
MQEWENIRIVGLSRLERVLAIFDVYLDLDIPIKKMKVKVIEGQNKVLSGITNLLVRSEYPPDSFEGAVGHGSTVEEVLEDTLLYFVDMVKRYQPKGTEDFEWAAPEDF